MVPSGVSFKEWQRLFLRGETLGIYFSLLSFAVFSVFVLYNRLPIFNFLVNEVALLTSFGVLVDLVSHLFSNTYNGGITLQEWIERFKKGRTHDVYGIIIQFGCSLFDLRFPYLIIVLWVSLAITAYLIIRSRFYH